MLDIILVIIFFSSLLGILYIILSKFPQLASIRLDIIPSEQQLVIRNKIIANRLKSKINNKKSYVLKTIRPFWLNFTSFFWKIYGKILEKERHLQHLAMSPKEKEDAKTKISELLEQANRATAESLYMRAERLYINIISLDPKNLDAYDGLAVMYRQQKDYQKAKETLKYLTTIINKEIKKKDDVGYDTTDMETKLVQYYLNLGELLQFQGNNEMAFEYYIKAIEVDENNPKALDQLIEISIMLKKINFAKEIIEKIKEVNPENKKIINWQRRIDDFEK